MFYSRRQSWLDKMEQGVFALETEQGYLIRTLLGRMKRNIPNSFNHFADLNKSIH